MRISAINNFTHQTRYNPGFKGILVDKGCSSDSWDYQGIPSSYNGDGHYVGSNDSLDYTYHPFSDESEESIRENIEKNNYSWDYATMGLGGGMTVSTERGKTLPYTEKEWNRLSEDQKRRIKSLL